MNKIVTIITQDDYIYNGAMVEGWMSYQEALNNETDARLQSRKKVAYVYERGQLIYKAEQKPNFVENSTKKS